MLQALLAGVASIKAQQTRMNVIGNNLANVNTTAYKGSRVTFQDMIAQTIRGAARPTDSLGGTNPIQYGLGVLIGGTDVNNEQGSLNATNRPTDLAIQGNGYFVVSNGDRVSYTRDGAFELDALGDLVHRATGERLLGWSADSFGNIDTNQPIGTASTLKIPVGALNAVQVTSRVDFAGNLNAAAPPTEEWNTIVRVYDSLGGQHDINVRFFNRQSHSTPPSGAPAGTISSWQWEATEPATGSTIIGSSSDTGNEPLYFDENGILLNASVMGRITVPGSTAAPAFPIDLDFRRVGQLATDTQVQASNQNGYPPGSLQGFSIGVDGIITGLFTNGLTRPLGQIAMAIFPNPNGLERMGNNLWRATDNSGIPVIGTPRTGGRGSVNSGFLEQSNVDIGNEFTELIVTQRGFQANTRVVTVVDEMLQELLNMKR
ncbi:MAG: flagellar hook protein FlgE [Fimbriimonadales bacterium]|nr:flagellar hook protein FlgE [Fimbriimonadales bacterium]